MSIGEQIRKRRNFMKLKQDELAISMGVSTKTIQRWESNQQSPRTKELIRLATVLHTTVASLTGETDDPAPTSAGTKQPNLPGERGDYRLTFIGRAVELPIYSLAACMGDGRDNERELWEKTGTAWLAEDCVGPLGPSKPYLINASGRSMEPKIYEGDRLVINENVMPGDGDICLARFTKGGYLHDAIKFFYSTPDGGFILKSSETSGIPPLRVTKKQAYEREAFVVGRVMYIDRGEKV